ncbi:MAG: hypothetical protein JST79_16380 [Acidobacteria bacterium]|nr:hypothetical protein [Acidobacteriota bacterium]
MLLRVIWVLLFATAAFAANLSPVQSTLDAKENELEALNAKYWLNQYQIEQGIAGVSNQEVEARIRQVVNDPAFLKQLEGARFSDPIWQRRRLLFLAAARDSQISTDAGLVKIIESIRKDSSALRYTIGGKQLDRPELDNVLGHEADRDLRREAWYAKADHTKLMGDRLRQAMKLRNQLAQRYTGQSYPDFMLQRRATDRASVLRWYEQIRSATQPEYLELLARVKKDLGVETVEAWDLEYYFSTLTPGIEAKMKAESTWEQTTRVPAVLGFDFKKLPVEVKITDITFGGYTMPIWYGKEIKMLVSNHQGVLFVDTMLHEAGHALHFSFVREPSYILRENYPPPMDEGLGQTLSLMLFRPEISTTIYGLSPEDSKALVERRRLQSNYDLRVLMLHSEFELEAYNNPDQDLTAVHDRICSKYLNVDCHGAAIWGYVPFYFAVPVYEQNYVLGEMFGYQVHHTLDRKFGRVWGAEAGNYLHDKFLVRGGSLTLDQIMLEGTGEKLTADYLIRALKARPKSD